MKERLPIVELLVKERTNENLSNVSVVARQHVFAQTPCMFQNLFKLGLKPENVFVLGKCYSTNDDVFREMKEQGIYVDDNSRTFDSHRPYDVQIEEHVKEFLSYAVKNISTDQVVILDSGGALIKRWRSFGTPQIFGVEQTSSGYHLLVDEKIPFPVVNVARSVIKQNVEAPYIAASFAKQLSHQIELLDVPFPKTAVVVGAGVIGINIRNELMKIGIHTQCYDHLNELTDIHQNEYLKILQAADLVIGTTGRCSLNYDMIQSLKNNVILASASSSDREFDPAIRLLVPQIHDCHQDMHIPLKNGKSIFLMNAGFPVNFTGKRYDLPLEFAQITAALLVQGILDVRSESTKGLIPFQSKSTEQLNRLLKSL